MGIKARTIIQMAGAPKKHIEDTIKIYVDKIKSEMKGVKLLKQHISKAEKEGEMFQVFAELEIEAKDTGSLVFFCFDYMPASIEILEPEEIVYDTKDFENLLNDLQAKMHKAESIVQNLSAENQVIKKNGVMLVKNIIMLQLKYKPSDLATLAINAGMPKEGVEKFLNSMITEGKIKKDGDQYLLA
jgi:hypothetical protein